MCNVTGRLHNLYNPEYNPIELCNQLLAQCQMEYSEKMVYFQMFHALMCHGLGFKTFYINLAHLHDILYPTIPQSLLADHARTQEVDHKKLVPVGTSLTMGHVTFHDPTLGGMGQT
jgi:hypothetical protein